MDIELFDKRYVYLEWSDELEGKDCILAKSYKDLKDFVNSSDEGRFCKAHKGKEKPFTNLWSECDFCYYDPNLKVKKAFYEGKAIQIKYHWDGKWENWTSKDLPSFENDYDFRIRPIEELYEVYTSDLDCFYIRDVERGVKYGKHSYCYFNGTYDECYDWVMNHKELYEVIWAWEQGKEIQWKHHSESVWHPCLTSKPCFDNSYDLRVKPTETEENEIMDYVGEFSREPRYYLSVNKNNYLEFAISENKVDNVIYEGNRKECERMMKIISDKFKYEDYREGNSCRARLIYTVNKYSHEKYKRRMTNRELAEWLAKGNGEFKNVEYLIGISTSRWYKNDAENENVDDNIFIRDFGSDEWREPLIEV